MVDYLYPSVGEWVKLNMVNTAMFAAYRNDVINKPVEMLECFATSLSTAVKVTIEEKEINSLLDLPFESIAIVEYKYGNATTWLYFKDRFVSYNPVENNKTFSYGKPIKAEIITFERIV